MEGLNESIRNISVDFDKLTINKEHSNCIEKNNLKDDSTLQVGHPCPKTHTNCDAPRKGTACSIDDAEGKHHSSEITNAREFRVGKVSVNRKIILGKGGCGIVYFGWSAQNKCTRLAVKVTTDKMFKESEVEVMHILSKTSHAHIIQLFEHSFTGTLHYISIDYCNGGDLNNYIAEVGTLPILEIKSLSRQMADALCHLATMNIVHRDIKLANIFIQHPDKMNRDWKNRIYKIGDFGLSRYLAEGELKMKAGTRGYFAPEMLMSRGYTNMADLFSMGVVLFVCYFGKLPFKRKPIEDYLRAAKIGVHLRGLVDADFENVLISLLQFSPGLRMNAVDYLNHPFHKDATCSSSSARPPVHTPA